MLVFAPCRCRLGREVSDPDGGGTAVLSSNTRAYSQSPFRGTCHVDLNVFLELVRVKIIYWLELHWLLEDLKDVLEQNRL